MIQIRANRFTDSRRTYTPALMTICPNRLRRWRWYNPPHLSAPHTSPSTSGYNLINSTSLIPFLQDLKLYWRTYNITPTHCTVMHSNEITCCDATLQGETHQILMTICRTICPNDLRREQDTLLIISQHQLYCIYLCSEVVGKIWNYWRTHDITPTHCTVMHSMRSSVVMQLYTQDETLTTICPIIILRRWARCIILLISQHPTPPHPHQDTT